MIEKGMIIPPRTAISGAGIYTCIDCGYNTTEVNRMTCHQNNDKHTLKQKIHRFLMLDGEYWRKQKKMAQREE